MRVVIQRVSKASVTVGDQLKSAIATGLLVLLGIEDTDTQEDIDFLVRKIINLRIFADENGVMNRSLLDIDGEVLCVSQFTLYASTKKGNRPSYIRAAKPDFAVPLYNRFCVAMNVALQKEIKTGKFGADMQVELINDGPVTILIDSKNRE
ncbi:MAG: D-tyrosyl-tRNA(Tyr) deacylase [Dysgonamonadaceae bacterium]|jgi:D-tyrosyl-tRNA(Tyr) deacylase|nr:D-tyrosyl-tRNA(Tyr) deacylase [Dysgonamonadaceae bacterium]